MTITQINRNRNGCSRSIAGLFWLLPHEQQVERIRLLARTFSAETISTITRKPVSEVAAIIEAAA